MSWRVCPGLSRLTSCHPAPCTRSSRASAAAPRGTFSSWFSSRCSAPAWAPGEGSAQHHRPVRDRAVVAVVPENQPQRLRPRAVTPNSTTSSSQFWCPPAAEDPQPEVRRLVRVDHPERSSWASRARRGPRSRRAHRPARPRGVLGRRLPRPEGLATPSAAHPSSAPATIVWPDPGSGHRPARTSRTGDRHGGSRQHDAAYPSVEEKPPQSPAGISVAPAAASAPGLGPCGLWRLLLSFGFWAQKNRPPASPPHKMCGFDCLGPEQWESGYASGPLMYRASPPLDGPGGGHAAAGGAADTTWWR